ncbi:MAG: acyltransferase family protein [Eubacteriales bacterium]|nr:acyltransferase family protein [Eubacteriales bacterium]
MELYQSTRRNAALEGLRGLAVLAVIGYHLFPNEVAGGYLGVVVFFVLSGYLIGDSLLYRDDSPLHFWKKRVLRLYPSLVAMLVGVTVAAALLAPSLLRNSLAEVSAALTYTHNWWQIAQGNSYFSQYLSPSLWTHLWSLAIEMQFYLLIAPVILLAKRWIDREKAIGLVLLIPLVASAVRMGWLYRPDLDPSRIYYGTDTRLFALLVGVVGACFVPLRPRRSGTYRNGRGWQHGLGWLAAAVLPAAFWLAAYRMTLIYYGGMLVFAVIVLFLIIDLRSEASALAAVFSVRPLRYLGSRSYALYLWQYPLMVLMKHSSRTADWPSAWALIVQLAVLLVVAELSYAKIELATFGPFHPIESWYRFQRRRNELRSRSAGQRLLAFSPYAVAGLSLIAAVLLWGTAPRGDSEETKRLRQAIAAGRQIVEKDAEETAHSGTDKVERSTEQTQPTVQEDPEVTPTAADLEKAKTQNYLLLGDSILLSNAVALKETFPQSRLIAEVGLQLYQAEDKLAELGEEALPANIVIALGTNAPVSDEVLSSLLSRLAGHHLYFVTVEGNVSHKDRINRQLAEAAKANDNVTLVDWSAYADGHKDWFYQDSVHPNEVGMTKYYQFLTKKMIDNYR